MLKLKQIVKNYLVGDEEVQALKGVDIEFRENEFVSILGQSGCGKTTLLNIIGGLDRYTSGDLIINEKSTKEFKDSDWDTYRNHSIGFVFQSYNLIPHQTVLSNVELALTLSGVSKSERRQRAIDVLTQVGLGDQLNKKPNQMSGGQMQRVAIARALINDPDILLADEPTGALDSETSVQIMEILKDISKDKLIVMVTHNPELAQQYSSRIIRLLDGKVIDDTNPYSANVYEPIKKDDDAKSKKKHKKNKKTSMSFFTALSLSTNNLMTKKARTFLTAFAGSIGIIGIALILSLSNGVQTYITKVQEDTLSTYPLTIDETSTDLTKLMQSMMEPPDDELEHKLDKVYTGNSMSEMMNSMVAETSQNNLKAFKDYIENGDGKVINDYASDIKYLYSTQMNVYRETDDDDVFKVNPSQVYNKMGYSDQIIDMQQSSMQAMGGSMSNNVWAEMIGNQDILDAQYDVIAGKMPENYDEIVVVVNKHNEIDDFSLFSLGLKDPDVITQIMSSMVTGETVDDPDVEFTYDEILDLKYKLILNTDYFKKDGDKWVDMTNDDEYMKSVIDNGITLKVVGILRPNEGASAASIAGTIGYKHELMEKLIEQVNDSEIVKQQLANPGTDVFTGLKFDTANSDTKTDNASSDEKSEDSTADSNAEKTLSRDEMLAVMEYDKMSAEEKAAVDNMSDDELSQMFQAMKAMNETEVDPENIPSKEEMMAMLDVDNMTDDEKAALAEMSDEELYKMIQAMQTMTGEDSKDADKTEAEPTQPATTYDENIKTLGVANLDSPSSINIYPKDFSSKEKITDVISDYNKMVTDDNKEENVIQYNDMVGLMMSSVTSIISAISYILIAFVAISLVVSSIMIGIITYISVLERTKEIGILRSIGASKKDISRVFNAETVIVGFTAGALGILISFLLTIPINKIVVHLTDVPVKAAIPISAAVILVCISMFLTFIAGLIPSKIAAKKDPVIALRTD